MPAYLDPEDLGNLPPFNASMDAEHAGMTNGQRAKRGAAIIKSYGKEMGFTKADMAEGYSIADPICDILHEAHRRGYDLEQLLFGALENFRAETTAKH